MSRFTETMFANAHLSTKGFNTGEPHSPVRHSWEEVHQRARRVAGGLAAAGVGPGDAVAMLAGAPVEIAPAAQGVWMRGASVTMVHQPTPRTDLVRWAEETTAVIGMISARAVVISDPFMAAAPVLEGLGMTVLTIADHLAADRVDPVDTNDDDIALMQLTSGSTGSPKAVQITHANIVANADAMTAGCDFDIDTDVIVSWLPCFHDMGMTGYLTVPMYFGAELVKVTPMDFLSDILLWPRLIDKYRGTMTAAPNFAYNLLARRLRRQADPGEFDLSSLRWALSGAEQVDPLDVEDLCDAGAPFGLKPEAIVPAYGMAETTVAVSFSECGGGMVVDEVDADLLAVLHRAVPATKGHTRRLVTLGRPLQGLEVRVVDEDGAELPARGVGVIEVRGEPVTKGYTTVAGFIGAQDDRGWYDTGDIGYLTEVGDVVVCGRLKDVIIMAGRNIYPTDIERAAGRVDGVRPGCAVAVRLEAGRSRETFAVAVECKDFGDETQVRRIERQVAHEVFAEVDVRPRNVVVLAPGTIPKTPSGKLRRAHALSLVS
ncbi:fatty acyl-AMP ligase [Mycolicibacterium austroafricanum]|uniref:Fatty acyl-AMP ligase n=1 Tax=Mycolicibacterium austroafricanum TaxID=39687 RepID=A0ABT8HI24_MYCAO|nr:fatty acyl-AMP ligase [Mycolicibacterium austroafricanum]MDN4520391.1 fatty acyl-AMP ligase [Mycolicibacterium austroafricanum]PQP38748.1 long-chain fatty acid--CoA ligase [Mycolicibacterium austroafricanum]QRZ07729.1 fatty acyl-AMP ligase [Mycolicibacterium austroafricanum]QZT69392.1 fatty acyl-AMP ligase [Mycolicibacterium austroafricanum]